MIDTDGAMGGWTAEGFKSEFATLRPLIVAEWPVLDGEALTATSGELERVVDLIADRTQHTKTLVRHMLRELHLVASHRAAPSSANGVPTIEAQLQHMLARLERKTVDLAAEIRGTIFPDARAKVRDHLWTSLFTALGLGFLFALFFNVGGRRRD